LIKDKENITKIRKYTIYIINILFKSTCNYNNHSIRAKDAVTKQQKNLDKESVKDAHAHNEDM